jgi:hypothetical protein
MPSTEPIWNPFAHGNSLSRIFERARLVTLFLLADGISNLFKLSKFNRNKGCYANLRKYRKPGFSEKVFQEKQTAAEKK